MQDEVRADESRPARHQNWFGLHRI
jgi:hypothetical protein